MPRDKDAEPRRPGAEDSRERLRPTVIGPPAGRVRAPDVGPQERDKAGIGPKPTVMTAQSLAARPSRAPAQVNAPSPRNAGPARPTAIPGVARKRIAVDRADLARLSPQSAPGVLDEARRLVQAFVVEGARDRQAVLWGHRIQQDYSELVSRSVELSQADVMKRVTAHLGRMTDILGAIDLEAVCGVAPARGLLTQYLKTVNSRIDTPEELQRARVELDQLLMLMGGALEPLMSFKDTLERHSRRIEEIADEVEAAALAAEFLAAHLGDSAKPLSQRFLERSMSLTQTVAQIRGSASMRTLQIEQPLRLIGAIQNVALVMVPGWLGSIAALATMLEEKRQVTPTQAGELTYQLRTILQQLKT